MSSSQLCTVLTSGLPFQELTSNPANLRCMPAYCKACHGRGLTDGVLWQYSMKTNESGIHFIQMTQTVLAETAGEVGRNLQLRKEFLPEVQPTCNVEILTLKQCSAINSKSLATLCMQAFFNFHFRTYVRSCSIVTHSLWTASLPFINTSSEVVKCCGVLYCHIHWT